MAERINYRREHYRVEGGKNYGMGEGSTTERGEGMGGRRWWYEREREKKGTRQSEKLADATRLIM
jgi:hypothetical protein